MKRFTSAVSLALLVAAVGCARERGEEVGEGVGTFQTWDTDRDGFLSNEELQTGYGRRDLDRDGLISEREFGD